ncbi:protein kinase [Ornithinimicrobium sp. Arc0846-15]|nr:protein kinase [Ornithinimicrobium laminariae]
MNAQGATAQEPEESRRIGDYVLGPCLGEGGMGVVYRSTDSHDREVAVKVLRPHIAGDQQARERLRREVETLERVDHPRVAAVLDADVDGPFPYIVTEYVPGVPLDALVEEEGALSPEGLVQLGRGLTEALSAIHGVGIVHRDLKPGNVLMNGGDPVVIDFGIAQVADDVRLTMTGMVMGTPGYLAPEIVEGAQVTEATDWWGWAALLAYAASAKPPFGRGPMSVVLDRVIRGRSQLGGVDEELRPLLQAALQPDQSKRPDSTEVMNALQAYAEHRPVTAELTRAIPVPKQGSTPDQPWPARAAFTDDATQRHPIIDATTVQPIASTRMQPQQIRPQQPRPPQARGNQPGRPASGPPQPRHPQQMPPPYAPQPYGAQQGRQPTDYRQQPPPGGWPQQQPGPANPYLAPGQRPQQPPQRYTQQGQPMNPAGQMARPNPMQPGMPPGQQQPLAQRPQGDPRIGRPMRTGTLAALLLLFVALSMVAPFVAWGCLAIWSVLSRWVDRTLTGLVLRRHEAGPRGSDVPMAMLAAPWHLVTAVLTGGLSLILPAAFAAVAAGGAALGLQVSGQLADAAYHPIPVAIGSALGAMVAWWGPGGVSLRRGSRTMIRAVLPSGPAATIGGVFILVGGGALMVMALLEGQDVSLWPWDASSIPILSDLKNLNVP